LSELTLTIGPAANGGSWVGRHDGRVVFVRYALPRETVRGRVRAERGSYWHADVLGVLEASPDRIEPLCPIAGVDGSGCCDLAFVEPSAVRRLKGEVVANQLARLGGFQWSGVAEEVGTTGATGWRTRVRLDVSESGHAGFHRYHSTELYPELNCGQLRPGLLDGVAGSRRPPGAQLHIAVDDDGVRHIVQTGPGRKAQTQVVEGTYEAVQRIGDRQWRVPVTAFWQAHRDAPELYSALIREAARLRPGMTAWDLYGGAGVFAAALAAEVGASGHVLTVDTSRGSARAARAALADMPWVSVVTDSGRRALSGHRRQTADVAVLDPPRTGAGREVIDMIAGVPRVIHIGCETASFARDVGEYLRNGYTVEQLRVFDAFPLTHHVECVAVLAR